MLKLRITTCLILLTFLSQAQRVIEIPFTPAPHIVWTGEEKAFFNEKWNTPIVNNVSKPTIEIYSPKEPNGTVVIIAPGGGLMAHSIESEGRMVAKWLQNKGITGIVLKYRLVPIDNNKKELDQPNRDQITFSEKVNAVLPYSIRDGLSAVQYVRDHAEELKIDPSKVGFMGFSAGGAVAMGVTYFYNKSTRPDFVVPVYPWTEMMPIKKPKKDSPPMLIICASNDPLGLAPGSISLYQSWLSNGFSVGLHMYSKGGHGFGMRTKNLATDTWIERFYEWALDEGFIKT
ncbi:alpha/beta hydrolase [Reichenbachiella versicolor]|uniref:alpha/beta hydrolase n=1 Tax=Reichenbachiella versicolor TaxID=1821036 RepID=UPI000D6E260E|nr:alpha/beta hydrolase [Reichenbachiella versicolor]